MVLILQPALYLAIAFPYTRQDKVNTLLFNDFCQSRGGPASMFVDALGEIVSKSEIVLRMVQLALKVE